MISNRYRRLSGSLLLALLLTAVSAGCAGPQPPPSEPPPIGVTILFFNDIHGHLQPEALKTDAGEKTPVGGVARIAALVERIRAENREKEKRTFLFIAGDILQGTPMSTVYQGKPDVEVYNRMGVDAMTVGNHEFDFGLDNFLELKRRAAFPFLSANVRVKDSGRLLCDPVAVFPLSAECRLTVIGLTTRELLQTTHPEYVKRLAVDDPLVSVRRAVREHGGRGPLVLLSHSRHRTDRHIAAEVPELDLIIAGHDHLLLDPPATVDGIPIFEALDNGRYLGRVDLAVDPACAEVFVTSGAYLPITADLPEDPAIADIVAAYRKGLDEKFTEVVGRSDIFLDGRRARVRYEETALGNFVADVMRDYAGTDIALLNSGALRDSIDPGPITLEDVFRVLPFSNDVVRVELTGEDINNALNRSVQGRREDEDGGFLQVSGLRFAVRGSRVENVRVDHFGTSLDPSRTYSVAVPEFLSSGGDGYSMLVGRPAVNTRLPLREIVVDAIRTRGPVSARTENRIVRVNQP